MSVPWVSFGAWVKGRSCGTSIPDNEVRSNLVGRFAVAGTKPMPLVKLVDAPVKIFHFIASAAGWNEYDIRSIQQMIRSFKSSQLAVSEAPVTMQVEVTTCAAVTLYDRERKVGAAMHFHEMDSGTYRGFISMALYKMGVLGNGRLPKVEARILGVENIPGFAAAQKAWVREIRSFLLRVCSVQVLPDDTGKSMELRFHLSDGRITY
jgi:hypothetical protein